MKLDYGFISLQFKFKLNFLDKVVVILKINQHLLFFDKFKDHELIFILDKSLRFAINVFIVAYPIIRVSNIHQYK